MRQAILFDAERRLRCRAALARDLAATTANRAAREQYLDAAAAYANAVPGGRHEMLLIRT